MMPSTSKSNPRKPKSKFVQKPKQEWRVKVHRRNWLELPNDVTANILTRVGVIDILENAQKVCTTWYKICKDPAMWRVIHMEKHPDSHVTTPLLRIAVNKSQGQLVDLTIKDLANHDVLHYIANRSSQLRRLDISGCSAEVRGGWTELLKKFRLLEELTLNNNKTNISKRDIETIGQYCPMLTTLKVNKEFYRWWRSNRDEESLRIRNEVAVAIGKNLPKLKHLEITGNDMSDIGLEAILDGCCQLESLDLRESRYVELEGDLGMKLSEKVKNVNLPRDEFDDGREGVTWGFPEDFALTDDEYDYDEYVDYDDYTNPYLWDYENNVKPDLGLSDSDDDFEDLDDMMTFMALYG